MVDAHRVAPKLWVGSLPPEQLKAEGFDVLVLCAKEHQDVRADIFTLRVPLVDTERPMPAWLLTESLMVANRVHQPRRPSCSVMAW